MLILLSQHITGLLLLDVECMPSASTLFGTCGPAGILPACPVAEQPNPGRRLQPEGEGNCNSQNDPHRLGPAHSLGSITGGGAKANYTSQNAQRVLPRAQPTGNRSARVRTCGNCASQKAPRAVLLALPQGRSVSAVRCPPPPVRRRSRRHAACRTASPPGPAPPGAPGACVRRGRRRSGPRRRARTDVLHLRLPDAGVLRWRQRAAGGCAYADRSLWHPGVPRPHTAGPAAWAGSGPRRGRLHNQVLCEQRLRHRERGLLSAVTGRGSCNTGYAGPGDSPGQPGEGPVGTGRCSG